MSARAPAFTLKIKVFLEIFSRRSSIYSLPVVVGPFQAILAIGLPMPVLFFTTEPLAYPLSINSAAY